jgi:hypothetical protein
MFRRNWSSCRHVGAVVGTLEEVGLGYGVGFRSWGV